MAKKHKKSELGKGIGALLSSFDTNSSSAPMPPEPESVSTDGIAMIALDTIEVNPHQPRKTFSSQHLQELSESIKTHGIIQPITVRRMGDGNYQLISGERRLRASKLAGLTQIPVYIRQATEMEMQEMALIENLQREDLSAMEVAATYQLLIDKYNLKHEDLAKRVGKSRVSITSILSLLTLPPTVIEALNNKEISRGHAIRLAGLDVTVQLDLLSRIVDEKLSVRALEHLIQQIKDPQPITKAPPSAPVLELEYVQVQETLKDFFGAKVKLKRKPNGKGQIMIPFNSDRDLNPLLNLLEED